ncbi:unnamed protein product [Rotaria sordida]|uniref:G-protein coupled receptors family 1 profile domain-containing protein n=1 Tax=Rotaria sordida TaxID=392033 RepID=A0A819Y5R2_9BILA|nr:unnamed protein product [Rotaria sordida]
MFFGLIGHIINIIIFTRPNLISNSCCNYCLASSCVSIIQILFGQLFRMLKAGYHIPIPSLWWCRIRTFFLYSTSLASIILITLASADRYVSSCSQVKYRQWANIKVARRLILIVLIISAVCRSHILSFFVIDEDEEDECWAPGTTDYRLIFDIVFLITHGLIFPVLLGTFGFLTIYNIRQRRQSDQQNGASILRQHRIRDFQRMTLIQTASAIVFTLPYAIHKLYRTVTASSSKSPENLAWERLIMSIVRLLWFLHDSGAFYIYSLSSVKFRHELLKFLKKHRPRRFLDLDGWINDPQSDSEDGSITTSSYYDNKGLFYDDNGENSNSNSYSADTLSYQKSKKYIEPTAEELEKQRESKKQSEQMNPFYLKDSKKNQN